MCVCVRAERKQQSAHRITSRPQGRRRDSATICSERQSSVIGTLKCVATLPV